MAETTSDVGLDFSKVVLHPFPLILNLVELRVDMSLQIKALTFNYWGKEDQFFKLINLLFFKNNFILADL